MKRFDATCGKIKNLLYKYRRILMYGMCSVIVTIIDASIVYIIMGHFSINIVIANTVGVVVGFLIHYSLSIKNVFAMKSDGSSFFVYLATFLMGLVFADFIVWLSYEVLKAGFLASKAASVIIPFFAMYSARKAVYGNMQKEGQ